MNKKLAIGIVAAIVVVAAAAWAVSATGFAAGKNTASQAGSGTGPATATPAKEFTVHGSNYKFDPATINVSMGDSVKITFIDDDGTHNICVEGIGCSSIIKAGETMLEFTANKTGTFEYYCSVGKHREFGMVGQLIVS